MKKLLITGLSAVLAIGFSACLSQPTNSGRNSNGDRMALVAKVDSAEYWVKVKEGAEATGEELGVDVSFNGPDTESEGDKQPNQLQSAINDKPLGIGFAPQDGAQDGAPALMDWAEESEVSVVIFNAPPSGSGVPVVIITSGNKNMGAQTAEKPIALTGDKGKVAIIARDEVDATTVRRDSFKEYLVKNAPELQAVGVQNDEPDPAKLRDKVQGILQMHPDLVGFFGTDDDLTIAIADEVAAKNLQAKAVGVDPLLDVISLLEQGRIGGTMVQNPYGMGKRTVELVVAVSKDENPTEKNTVSESVWVTVENFKGPDVQQIVN